MAENSGGEVDGFRAEARAWLQDNFPPALKSDPMAQLASAMGGTPSPDAALWGRRMGEKGWGTPTWPKAYGGGGLSRADARILAEEMAAIGGDVTIDVLPEAGIYGNGHTMALEKNNKQIMYRLIAWMEGHVYNK